MYKVIDNLIKLASVLVVEEFDKISLVIGLVLLHLIYGRETVSLSAGGCLKCKLGVKISVCVSHALTEGKKYNLGRSLLFIHNVFIHFLSDKFLMFEGFLMLRFQGLHLT